MVGILIWIIRASTKLALPQNPTTIIGLAICMSSSCAMVETLSSMGSSGRDTLQAVLDGCHYRSCWDRDNGSFEVLVEERLPPNDDLEMRPPEHSVFKPMTLRIPVRLTSATILLAIIVSLEVTLRLSKRDQGLGDVPLNSEAISYLWTSLPGLTFTLISMYYSSVDFDTRSLVPFLHLSRGSKFQSSVRLDLVNKHTFLLLYEELKTKSFEALASTLGVTLTSFLTIFSTGLFTSVVVTRHVSTELSIARPIWYNTEGTAAEFGWSDRSMDSAALILASNLSYPSFTYQLWKWTRPSYPSTQTHQRSNSALLFSPHARPLHNAAFLTPPKFVSVTSQWIAILKFGYTLTQRNVIRICSVTHGTCG